MPSSPATSTGRASRRAHLSCSSVSTRAVSSSAMLRPRMFVTVIMAAVSSKSTRAGARPLQCEWRAPDSRRGH